ncbi:hypothetical protein BHM03_00011081 [Ensete ventricosum]|nr:hypothetical protein BHM03_00011081 [Ensete ventricosum]
MVAKRSESKGNSNGGGRRGQQQHRLWLWCDFVVADGIGCSKGAAQQEEDGAAMYTAIAEEGSSIDEDPLQGGHPRLGPYRGDRLWPRPPTRVASRDQPVRGNRQQARPLAGMASAYRGSSTYRKGVRQRYVALPLVRRRRRPLDEGRRGGLGHLFEKRMIMPLRI